MPATDHQRLRRTENRAKDTEEKLAQSREAPGADLTDAAATIAVADGHWRRLPASTLTANRTVTLSAEGAKEGEKITITRLDAEAFTLTIANGGEGEGTLVVLPASLPGFAVAQFDGTDWLLKAAGTVGGPAAT